MFDSTSQLLDSLCYCLHYCRKIFSGLRKRLFSFLKPIISLRCQAWHETCFFFHATAPPKRKRFVKLVLLPTLLRSMLVRRLGRERKENRKRKETENDILYRPWLIFFDNGPHFYSDLARGFSCSSRPMLPTRGVFWQKHIVTSCLATSWRK